ncbi:unnamed protein product, partial [Brenthis ino]
MTINVKDGCAVNDAIVLVMKVARWFGIAPVRFVKLKTKTSERQGISMKRYFQCLIFVFIFCAWVLEVADMWKYKEWFTLYVHWQNFAVISILVMMEFQFILIAMYINTGFKAINESLYNIVSNFYEESSEKLLKTHILKLPVNSINAAIDTIGMTNQRYPDMKIKQKLKLARKIREVSQCYVDVCDVLRDLSSSESIILFLQLITTIVHIVITSFNAVKMINLENRDGCQNSYLARTNNVPHNV